MNRPVPQNPWPIRLYSQLLWLYPADFRRHFGAEMILLFRELYRDQQAGSKLGLLRFLLAAYGETVHTALVENLHDWEQQMKTSHRFTALLGLAFLAYSSFFAIFNILKYNLGVPFSFDPFANLTPAGPPTLWHTLWNALIIFGPVIALLLFALPAIQFRFNRSNDPLLAISLRQTSRLNLILIGLCLTLLAVFVLYAMAENLACLPGSC